MKKAIKIAFRAGSAVVLLLGMTGCFLMNGGSPVPSYNGTEEAFEALGYTTQLPTWVPEGLERREISVWGGGLGISYSNGEGNYFFQFSADKTDLTVPEPTDGDEDFGLVLEKDRSGNTVTVEWHPGFERYRAYWHQDGVLYEINTGYGFSLEDLSSIIEGVQ